VIPLVLAGLFVVSLPLVAVGLVLAMAALAGGPPMGATGKHYE
jgi:hypothetical protein